MEQRSHCSQTRFNKGLRGLWDRLTGQHGRIRGQNERKTLAACERDRAEKDVLIFKQLEQRRALQARLSPSRRQRRDWSRELGNDIAHAETQRMEAQGARQAELREQRLSMAWSQTDRQPHPERRPKRSRRHRPERDL